MYTDTFDPNETPLDFNELDDLPVTLGEALQFLEEDE